MSGLSEDIEAGEETGRASPSVRALATKRRKRPRWVKRSLQIMIGGLGCGAGMLFGLLPLATASAVGGWLFRKLGPLHRRHAMARYNMQMALPELSQEDLEAALDGMWDNFGRVLAEYAHFGTFRKALDGENDVIEFAGLEVLEALKTEYRGAIFVGGHIGNWELGPLIMVKAGIESAAVYRPPNIALIDRWLFKQRSKILPAMIAKRGYTSKESRARDLAWLLHNKSAVTMAVDQKFKRGMSVPFFGHEAMTITAPARLALKYGVPIVPVRVERVAPARYRITAYPPLKMPSDGEREEKVQEITLALNRILEDWIRERPDQWHWMHSRWPK